MTVDAGVLRGWSKERAELYMSNSPIRFFSATVAPPESIVRLSVEA